MIKVCCDFETRSEVDLKAEGRWKYAHHPSTEILMMSYKVGSGPTELWLPGDKVPVWATRTDTGEIRVDAHTSEFERLIWSTQRHKWGFAPLPIEYTNDVMALCGRYGVPQSLELAAIALNIRNKKLPGGPLIRLFCCPPFDGWIITQGKWTVNPRYETQWEQFKTYCIGDTNAEYDILQVLPADHLSAAERQAWELSCKINETGIPVDVISADQILELTQVYLDERNALLPGMTEGKVSKITQVKRIKEYINEQLANLGKGGIEDLTKDTVSKLLQRDDLPDNILELVEMRADIGLSSIGKFKRIRDMSVSGRIYDNIRYYGTHTGRWSGAGFQLLNLPRARVDDPEAEIAKFMDNTIAYENPVKSARALIRPMIKAKENHILMVADYASIEYVVLEWFAGATHNLTKFSQGLDQYIDQATAIYNAAYEAVTKDQRQVGKIVILGCGYNLGAHGLVRNADQQWGMTMSLEEAQVYVTAYRQQHKEVVQMWWKLKDAMLAAITYKGQKFSVAYCTFQVVRDRNYHEYLVLTLPSGRAMYYRDPHIEQDTYGPIPCHWGTHPKTKQWRPMKLTPGRITENIVQAAARDILVAGKIALDKAGFKIIGSIYDEVICEVPKAWDTEEKYKEFIELFTSGADWCRDIPLQADGYIATRYRKG